MINIQDIIPFMKKGWVAMDKNGEWYWYGEEIERDAQIWFGGPDYVKIDDAFDIATADDWTKSLIKVKGVKIMDWFKYPELEKYAEIIANAMEDSMNINFNDEKTEEIYFIVGKKYGYEYQGELLYRSKAIAQDKGKLRTTDVECSKSYKNKKNKPLI